MMHCRRVFSQASTTRQLVCGGARSIISSPEVSLLNTSPIFNTTTTVRTNTTWNRSKKPLPSDEFSCVGIPRRRPISFNTTTVRTNTTWNWSKKPLPSDESNDVIVIDKQPGIQFINGKLERAIKQLNLVCGYWLSARFSEGPYCVDMLKGNTVKCNLDDTVGVVHYLVFPTVDKPTPVHPNEFYLQNEKKKSEDVATLISTHGVKILILDNNVARLRQSELSITEHPKIEVDARTEIDEKSFKNSGFAMALVHKSNDESNKIYEHWAPHIFPIVFFSGGNTGELKKTEEGRYWHTSAKYLEDNMIKVLTEVLENAGLS